MDATFEVVEPPTIELAAPRRGVVGTIAAGARAIASAVDWLFGVVSMIVLLAVVAAMPIVQFLTLGYLLEVAGRIGRSGRLRDGFPGIRQASRIGGVLLGCAIPLLPLHLVTSFWISAELIEPGGRIARNWKIALIILSVVSIIHIALACARGGRLRYFLWPFGNPFWAIRRFRKGGFLREARDGVWDFTASLQLPYLFWLGVRGFAGAFLWLAVPITLLAIGRKVPPLGLLGGALLIVVFLYVPFLQTHFAATNRFRAFRELGAVRRLFTMAPWGFAASFLITIAFALPLYLLKIEMIPREAAWLPSIVFIVFMFPARLVTGWAYGTAARRERNGQSCRHWFFRWTGRLFMLVIAFIDVVIVFFSQFIAWGGIGSLYEQHAFLLPVPFWN